MRSRSSLEGHIRLRRRADIGRARPNEPIVVLLLDDVRAPAGDARADEDRRVGVAGKPYQEGGHGGVEVQGGVEGLFLLHDPIHDGRDVVPPRVAARPAQGLGMTLDDGRAGDRKSTRLNSSHLVISYAVFCLKKKNKGNGRIVQVKTREVAPYRGRKD